MRDYDEYLDLNTYGGQLCLMQRLRQEYYRLERMELDTTQDVFWLRNTVENTFLNLREEDMIAKFTEFVNENINLVDYRAKDFFS